MLHEDTESRFKAIIDLAVDTILLGAPDGTIIDANQQATELTGYSREELVGMNIRDLFSVQENERTPLRYDLLKAGKVVRASRILTRRDSSTVPIEMNTRMMPDATYQTFIRDMTERVAMEKALRRSEEKFSKAFHTSPDSININRMSDGMYIDVNEGFLQMSGYSRDEVIGRTSQPGELGIWVNKEDRDQMVARLREKGEVVGFEAPFRCKDGHSIQGSMSARIVEINGEDCILSFTRDITLKKKADDALQNAQKIEALGVLAGGIAHDFNNMLVGVFGYIDLALSQIDPNCLAAAYLNNAMSASNRARALTQQLLTFAKGGEPVKKTVYLDGLLKNAAQFALSGSSVTAEFDIDSKLWPVDADENQLGHVIDNLLINARQAMPLGGTVRISASNIDSTGDIPSSLQANSYVRLQIEDQGIGISREILSRIFDPFFTTKQEGSGLGLAMAYSVIKKHGGTISADSLPGKGAVFTIFLSAVRENADSTPVASMPQQHLGRGTVLFMDDEEIVREVGEAILNDIGYSVSLIHEGKAAVALYAAALQSPHPFDLVILDLTIPGGMGGKAAAGEILKIDPAARIIASSGYSDDPVMANPDASGFKGALAKPYRRDDVCTVLKKVLLVG